MTQSLQPRLRPVIALSYGALCHACFAVGVGTMVVMMFFGMSGALGSLKAPWSWVANAALLAQFIAMHSLLLTGRGSRVLAGLAPRGTGTTLSTTTYVSIASLQILALFALWSPSGVIWWQAEGVTLALLTALYATSWLALSKAMADAGLSLQTGSLGWWALLRNRAPVYPKLPEGGLFRLTRQPIYVAFTLTLWTVPTRTPVQLVLARVLTLYCLIGPPFQEGRFHPIYRAALDN